MVIVFSGLISTINQQKTKNRIQSDLFQTAHSISSILEDKTYLQLPLDLFLLTNQTDLTFLSGNSYTNIMNIADINQNFQVVIPEDLIRKNQNVNFVLNQGTLYSLNFYQLIVFASKEYQGHLLYGYANCFVK